MLSFSKVEMPTYIPSAHTPLCDLSVCLCVARCSQSVIKTGVRLVVIARKYVVVVGRRHDDRTPAPCNTSSTEGVARCSSSRTGSMQGSTADDVQWRGTASSCTYINACCIVYGHVSTRSSANTACCCCCCYSYNAYTGAYIDVVSSSSSSSFGLHTDVRHIRFKCSSKGRRYRRGRADGPTGRRVTSSRRSRLDRSLQRRCRPTDGRVKSAAHHNTARCCGGRFVG